MISEHEVSRDPDTKDRSWTHLIKDLVECFPRYLLQCGGHDHTDHIMILTFFLFIPLQVYRKELNIGAHLSCPHNTSPHLVSCTYPRYSSLGFPKAMPQLIWLKSSQAPLVGRRASIWPMTTVIL